MKNITDERYSMQDPREQYPKPPFAQQPQNTPGLAKKMEPKPDHGESSYVGTGKLRGRKALITGADSGIGRAVAIAFAREGADVAMHYLPSEESDANEVRFLVEEAKVRVFAIAGDISDEGFCRTLVQQAHQQLEGLDILVNNAGTMMSHKDLSQITSEDFDKTMKTNVYGMFWITQAAVPLLQPGASIINTVSVQAYKPTPVIVDYAMTKAAMVAFTKGLAKPLMEKGIRINGVAPGPFWTPIQPNGHAPAAVTKLGEEVPFKRPGQPVEIAPVYVLLASQEGSYITGEIYGVTGGMGIA